jgi:glycosyltransferase involved in cell wall biosynthesis
MAVYNGERFLREAIESILSQSFRDFELIVIDDGSRDATATIIRSFDDARIRVITNATNCGVGRCRNAGLIAAKGEYVACMDADDISAPQRFAKQVAFLDLNPRIALVGGNAKIVDAAGIVRGTPTNLPTDPAAIREHLLRANCFVHSSTTARTDCLRRAGGYDESMPCALDYDLYLRLSENYDLANMPETLVKYRVHHDQLSISRIKQQRRLADECRRRAIVRRSPGSGSVERRGFSDAWMQLRAYPSTLGYEYVMWSRRFAACGDISRALSLALRAIAESPLSASAYASGLNAAAELSLGPNGAKMLRWWTRRLFRRA